ncbi:MAG: diguanylate cyclase DgcA [Spirochaetota bacterium]|nr:diguanylate cyclase DgcA [Spirochaetota bacterium]
MDKQNDEDLDHNIKIIIDQFEKKIYDLTQLIEISKGLNSTLDSNILIESILLTCMGQMLLVKAGIFLQKDISNNTYILHRNYKGFELNHDMEYEIDADSHLMRFLEDNFRCYTLNELNEIIGDDPSTTTLKIIGPSLIVPLKGKGKLNGIIILGERINDDPFTEVEKQYLLDIASLAGIAIQNAHLFEMATTDMMTKLKIHHFFQTSLVDDRKRAIEQKVPLSLIMIDIDNFKDFNDNYGHTCGDIVLKNVARLIMENVRQSDLASRYGGEEFGIILPDTDIEEALIVAERIKSCVEELNIEYDNKTMGVTVSIGIAQLNPVKDKDAKDLINKADKALYISKAEGKNRISLLK